MSKELTLAERREVAEKSAISRRKIIDEACRNCRSLGNILVPYSVEASSKAEAFELLANAINADSEYLRQKGYRGSYAFVVGPEFNAVGVNGVIECSIMIPFYIHRPLT